MQTEQARRIVWRRLDEARTIKARQRAGIAFEWEGRRLTPGAILNIYKRKNRDEK